MKKLLIVGAIGLGVFALKSEGNTKKLFGEEVQINEAKEIFEDLTSGKIDYSEIGELIDNLNDADIDWNETKEILKDWELDAGDFNEVKEIWTQMSDSEDLGNIPFDFENMNLDELFQRNLEAFTAVVGAEGTTPFTGSFAEYKVKIERLMQEMETVEAEENLGKFRAIGAELVQLLNHKEFYYRWISEMIDN